VVYARGFGAVRVALPLHNALVDTIRSQLRRLTALENRAELELAHDVLVSCFDIHGDRFERTLLSLSSLDATAVKLCAPSARGIAQTRVVVCGRLTRDLDLTPEAEELRQDLLALEQKAAEAHETVVARQQYWDNANHHDCSDGKLLTEAAKSVLKSYLIYRDAAALSLELYTSDLNAERRLLSLGKGETLEFRLRSVGAAFVEFMNEVPTLRMDVNDRVIGRLELKLNTVTTQLDLVDAYCELDLTDGKEVHACRDRWPEYRALVERTIAEQLEAIRGGAKGRGAESPLFAVFRALSQMPGVEVPVQLFWRY